jgi:hypothetical protein
MKRSLRFGKDMMPRKEKPKTVLSKKPRPFRKMKRVSIKMETLNLQKDLEDDAS